MKGKNFREAQEEYKDAVVGLCIICQKPTSGWYGRWGNLGTCSKKCELVQEDLPKYLPSSAKTLDEGEGNALISQRSNQAIR